MKCLRLPLPFEWKERQGHIKREGEVGRGAGELEGRGGWALAVVDGREKGDDEISEKRRGDKRNPPLGGKPRDSARPPSGAEHAVT